MKANFFHLKLFHIAVLLILNFNLSAQNLPSIKVSSNGRFLIKADGNPFFWIGDTEWELFHRLNRNEVDQILKNRADKGYNLIQAVLLGELDGLNTANAYGDKPLTNNDPKKLATTSGNDPADATQYDYWDHCDYIINKAEQLGLYMGVLPTWGDKVNGGGPAIFTGDNTKPYEYGYSVGSRYKNKTHIVWILGGDRGPDNEDIWRAMAEGIADGINGAYGYNNGADYSTTIMTYHPSGGNSSGKTFHNDAWLDFNMYQSGHSAYNLQTIYSLGTTDYNRSPVKPTLNGEPNYENHPVNWNPTNGWFTDYDVRKSLYWSVFAGCAGYTYGVHSIWQMYAPGRNPINSPKDYWYNELDLPGSYQLVHAKNLMLSRPYFTRQPDQSLLNNEGTGGSHVRATRASDGAYAMIYFPSENISKTVYASKLSGTQIKAWWFNPRDGKCYNDLGNVTTQPFSTFNKTDKDFDPPGSNGSLDWVLVLDDASKNVLPPGQGTAGSGLSVIPDNPSICIGSSTTITVTGANTYTWSPPSGLSATTGASVTASPAATTTYTVTGTDGSGTTKTANVTVTVNPVPATPAITQTGCNQLSSSSAGSNQWYLNGSAISGATSATYSPTQSGSYTVEANNNGCKSAMSAAYTYTHAGNLETSSCAKSITVDGKLDESIWTGSSQSVCKVIFGNGGNVTASFKTRWDDQYLYIGADVTDAQLNNSSAYIWENSAVELFLDMNNGKTAAYEANDFQYIIGWNNPNLFEANNRKTGVLFNTVNKTGGYTAETGIPWATLGVTPTKGMTYGFDASIDISHTAGTRTDGLVWSGDENNFQNTTKFGELKLDGNCLVTSVEERESIQGLSIYPNPANKSTRISFITGMAQEVSLKVYDFLGREVSSLVDQKNLLAGKHEYELSLYTGGIYFIKLMAGDKQVINKVVFNY